MTVSAPVAVTVTGPEGARFDPVELSGRALWSEDLADYLGDELHDLGVCGGQLKLHWSRGNGLRAVACFITPEKLSRKDLQLLLREVHGQYLDGVGEGGFQMDTGSAALRVELVLARTAAAAFSVEQRPTDAVARRPSPLLKAAEAGDEDRVRALLQQGEPVDTVGRFGVTPLILAAQGHHADAVRALLAAGADPRKRSSSGASVLLHAVMGAAPVKVVQLLLENGADVHVASDEGYTPVGMAANRGLLEVLELLLDQGADVNARDASGNTPLMKATAHVPEVVALLLKRGADPHLTNREGQDACQEALWQASAWAQRSDPYSVSRATAEQQKAELIRTSMTAS